MLNTQFLRTFIYSNENKDRISIDISAYIASYIYVPLYICDSILYGERVIWMYLFKAIVLNESLFDIWYVIMYIYVFNQLIDYVLWELIELRLSQS